MEKLDVKICFHLCNYIYQTIEFFTSSRVFGWGWGQRKEAKLKSSFYLAKKYFKISVKYLKRGFNLLIKIRFLDLQIFTYPSYLPLLLRVGCIFSFTPWPDSRISWSIPEVLNLLFWKGHILLPGGMELNHSKWLLVPEFCFYAFMNISNSASSCRLITKYNSLFTRIYLGHK